MSSTLLSDQSIGAGRRALRLHPALPALVALGMLVGCARGPSASEAEEAVSGKLREGDQLSRLKCEFFPSSQKDLGRASCVGAVRAVEDLYVEVPHADVVSQIPGLADSKFEDEGMQRSREFTQPASGPVIQPADASGNEREFRTELMYARTVDSWKFTGGVSYDRPVGTPISGFWGQPLVMGSKEWEKYRDEVSAKYAKAKQDQAALMRWIEAFFAPDAKAQFADRKARSENVRTTSGVMVLTFKGVRWGVPASGVPGIPFSVDAVCEWRIEPLQFGFRHPNQRDSSRECSTPENNRIVITGTVYPGKLGDKPFNATAAMPTLYRDRKIGFLLEKGEFVADAFHNNAAIWK